METTKWVSAYCTHSPHWSATLAPPPCPGKKHFGSSKIAFYNHITERAVETRRGGTHPVALQEQGGLPGLGLDDGGGLLLHILAILAEHLRLERREELGHRNQAGAAAHLPPHALPSSTTGERPAAALPRKAGGEGPDRRIILRRGRLGRAQGERRQRGRHVQQHGGRRGAHVAMKLWQQPKSCNGIVSLTGGRLTQWRRRIGEASPNRWREEERERRVVASEQQDSRARLPQPKTITYVRICLYVSRTYGYVHTPSG